MKQEKFYIRNGNKYFGGFRGNYGIGEKKDIEVWTDKGISRAGQYDEVHAKEIINKLKKKHNNDIFELVPKSSVDIADCKRCDNHRIYEGKEHYCAMGYNRKFSLEHLVHCIEYKIKE